MAEHYNVVARLLERGVAVKLRVNVQTTFHEDRNSYNVIAEIPGTDLADEVITIGGHLDSWDLGQGAIDDGAGVAITAAAAAFPAWRALPTARRASLLEKCITKGLKAQSWYGTSRF